MRRKGPGRRTKREEVARRRDRHAIDDEADPMAQNNSASDPVTQAMLAIEDALNLNLPNPEAISAPPEEPAAAPAPRPRRRRPPPARRRDPQGAGRRQVARFPAARTRERRAAFRAPARLAAGDAARQRRPRRRRSDRPGAANPQTEPGADHRRRGALGHLAVAVRGLRLLSIRGAHRRGRPPGRPCSGPNWRYSGWRRSAPSSSSSRSRRSRAVCKS